MQCKCGGETVDRASVRKNLPVHLEFVECRSCGRTGRFLMKRGKVIVMRDEEARRDWEYLSSQQPNLGVR